MIAYTVVPRSRIPQARVLATSFRNHNPADEIWTLVVDDVGDEVNEGGEPFRVLRLSDLDLDRAELHRMAMLVGGHLAAAVKPWVFRHLLSSSRGPVVHLSSDTVVYGSLEPLAQAARHGVALVPRLLRPMPRDGKDPDETDILGHGIYDAGLLGVGPDDGGFVAFLEDHLRRQCEVSVPRMRVEDQRWLDFVPSLFPYRVVRDPGVGVAYWNLHERPLGGGPTELLAGGSPLRCMRFPTFDPRMQDVAGRFERAGKPRVTRLTEPRLDELCRDYGRRLFDAGFDELHDTPFAFDTLPDGAPVYDSLRGLYTEALAAAEVVGLSPPPDPFDPATTIPFREWAAEAYKQAGQTPPGRLNLRPAPPPAASSIGLPSPAAPSPAAASAAGLAMAGVLGAWRTTRRTARRVMAGLRRRASHLRARFGSVPGPVPTPQMAPAPDDGGPEAPAVGEWATDWLDSLEPGPGGIRLWPTGPQVGRVRRRAKSWIDVAASKAGVVGHGEPAPLDPGRYQATIELAPGPRTPGRSPHDQAVVVEVLLDGYALGHRAATFGDIEQGPLVVEFTVPACLEEAALIRGVELRILSRGSVDAVVGAALVERFGPPAGRPAPARSEWLAIMGTGPAGRRAGVEVNALPDRSGVVLDGPYWRLPAGPYEVGLRIRRQDSTVPPVDGQGPAAVLEATVGEAALARLVLSHDDLDGAEKTLRFDLGPVTSGPDARVALRLATGAPIGFAVEALSVRRRPATVETAVR